jgi:hypothetical protein
MADPQITVLDQLDQLEEVVLDGSRIPFSGGRLVNETDAMEVIDALREAVPPQLALARDLLNQKDDFIGKARHQADDILQAAQREREQLINSAGIRQEAERQVNEMREQARQQCDQLLLQARAQAAQAEQEQQMRLAQLEQQFAARRQQLEQEAAERQRLLVEQHDRNRQQAMAELEQIRQEGLRVQQASPAVPPTDTTAVRCAGGPQPSGSQQRCRRRQPLCRTGAWRAREPPSGSEPGRPGGTTRAGQAPEP